MSVYTSLRMRTTSGATHQTGPQRPTSMRTSVRTQSPILRYGVHSSTTSLNPRIGYLVNVSKFLDPHGISSRAQFIYPHIDVPTQASASHSLSICSSLVFLFPAPSILTVWRVTGHGIGIYCVSLFFSFVWVFLGWLQITYPYLYVLLTRLFT